MFASLDGELKDKETGQIGVYEGKTAEIHRKIELDAWNKRVPDYYFIQVLHQLIVTGREFAVLKAQLKLLYKEELEIITRHYRFDRKDWLDDLAYVYRKEARFMENVRNNIRPALILPRLIKN